jgi:hypothetical protein
LPAVAATAGAVLAVAVTLCGPRELFGLPALWVGAVLAALITAPTLVWQAAHDWPQLAMAPVVAAAEAEYLYGGRAGVAVQMLVRPGIIGAALAVTESCGSCARPSCASSAWLRSCCSSWSSCHPDGPTTSSDSSRCWPPPGAVGLQRRREAGRTRWRWLAWPATALAVVGRDRDLVAHRPPRPVGADLGRAAVADGVVSCCTPHHLHRRASGRRCARRGRAASLIGRSLRAAGCRASRPGSPRARSAALRPAPRAPA